MDATVSAGTSAKHLQGFLRRHLLAILLAAALLLRLAVIPILGIHHPDELWQYLEPAHELAFGRGVDAWEFRVGIRTWVIPVFIAPFMWLGDTLAPDSLLYIYLPKAMLALLSLVIVWSWWTLGSKVSRTHAIVAAFVAATWVELVYFGGKPLSEPVSMALFFAAAVFLTRKEITKRELILAGFLLGLAFSVRFQLAPALLCLVVCTEWRRLRQSIPWIVAGGLTALALDGLIDLSVGEVPFRWTVENFRINFIEDKSSEYGRYPGYFYFGLPITRWGGAVGPIVVLAAVGARRFPGLALVALVHVAVHSLVPHKEFRFVLLAFEIAIFLAAIGTSEGISLARSGSWKRIWMGLACGAWLSVSLHLAASKPLRDESAGSREVLQTLLLAGRSPGVCGLAAYELSGPISIAYTYYHRDTPIFGFKGNDAEFRAHQDRFNVVIATPARPPGGDYDVAGCTSKTFWHPPYCVHRRPGGCSSRPAPQFEINRFLAKEGV